MKTNFSNRGQSLIGIIIVLVIVGLISGGLYYYFLKQIPEVLEITREPAEEIAWPPKEEIPPEEKPSEVSGEEKLEVICKDDCFPDGFKRCYSYAGYQICGNYDADSCLEWSSIITHCPSDTTCQNGICIQPPQRKCADGTLYGQCSTDKPKYCENGNLIDKASICGCPSGHKVLGNKCEKIVLPKPYTYTPIIVALNKTYANKLPDWKEKAKEAIETISFVFGKTTKVQFKITKYLVYNDSEYANLFLIPDKHPEFYQVGGVTLILLVYKDGLTGPEMIELYGPNWNIINAFYSVTMDEQVCPTILAGGSESFNLLLDETRTRSLVLPIHEMGHAFGLAVPDWHFYKYSDCTGIDPRFPDCSVAKDPYFSNDPMATPPDVNSMTQFNELNSVIINKNLNFEYTYDDVRTNWFSRITKVYVTDKLGTPIPNATVKIFCVRKGCFYCSTECRGAALEYRFGVPEGFPPEQTLVTDKNGYAIYNGPVGNWDFNETKNSPCIAKAIKVYHNGKSNVKVVNFIDLQKSYVLNNSNEHIAHIILE